MAEIEVCSSVCDVAKFHASAALWCHRVHNSHCIEV
jgi:hypothetical protein